MDGSHSLYVLFSSTPYRMGSWIRWVTRERYNHVSIATEADLSTLYSFARRYYHTPFYGGFVTEHPSRYRHGGTTASICLYRLPLTQSQWQKLQAILTPMRSHQERYLYNHLSALAAPLGRKIPVRDAFTCAEFTVSVLSQLGYDFDPRRFYSIGAIARQLEAYHIYTGVFPGNAEGDPAFFAPNPVSHPLRTSTASFLRLLWRAATT